MGFRTKLDREQGNYSQWQINNDLTAWSEARYPLNRKSFDTDFRDRIFDNRTHRLQNKIDNETFSRRNITAWAGGKFWSDATQTYRPLSIPLLVQDNDRWKFDKVLGDWGRLYRLLSRVSRTSPAWRGPFTVDKSFFASQLNLQDSDLSEEQTVKDDFFVTKGIFALPDIAFRIRGSIAELLAHIDDDHGMKGPQKYIFVFRYILRTHKTLLNMKSIIY
jgi:hypothetical protein